MLNDKEIQELAEKLESSDSINFKLGDKIIHVFHREDSGIQYDFFDSAEELEEYEPSQDMEGGVCTGRPFDAIEMAVNEYDMKFKGLEFG